MKSSHVLQVFGRGIFFGMALKDFWMTGITHYHQPEAGCDIPTKCFPSHPSPVWSFVFLRQVVPVGCGFGMLSLGLALVLLEFWSLQYLKKLKHSLERNSNSTGFWINMKWDEMGSFFVSNCLLQWLGELWNGLFLNPLRSNWCQGDLLMQWSEAWHYRTSHKGTKPSYGSMRLVFF